MWSARRVLRYNRDSHRFGSPPLSSSLSFGFVFRNPDGPGSRAARKGGIEFGAVRIAYPVNQTVPSTDYFVFVVFEFFFSSSSSFSWLAGEGRFRGIGTSTITFQFRLTRRGKILPFSSLNIHSLRKKLLLAIFARLRDLFKW